MGVARIGGVGPEKPVRHFNGDDSPAGLVTGRTPLELGRWYHVVLTRQGERVMLHLNGELELNAKPTALSFIALMP